MPPSRVRSGLGFLHRSQGVLEDDEFSAGLTWIEIGRSRFASQAANAKAAGEECRARWVPVRSFRWDGGWLLHGLEGVGSLPGFGQLGG
jgi:hypothetical protein